MIYYYAYKFPISEITIASEDGYIIGCWLKNQKYFLSDINEEMIKKETKEIKETKIWLEKYFQGNNPSIKDLKLKTKGTVFQNEVWNILKKIPYGKVITYKDIAVKIAEKNNIKKMSAQAVGQAVSHNPISIIIPCHRVIGTDRSLTGYAGGIGLKMRLLKGEGIKIEGNKVI